MSDEKHYENYLARLPEDARVRLDAPRPEDFVTDPTKGQTIPTCLLRAENPETSASRFLELINVPVTLSGSPLEATWVNATEANRYVGGGNGFYNLEVKPVVEVSWQSRLPAPELWSIGQFFVASTAAAELISTRDPEALRTVEISIRTATGALFDGYVFLDIVRCLNAVDYLRSDVEVYLNQGRRYLRVGQRVSLRADVPSDAHIFRDKQSLENIFFSRELACELEELFHARLRLWDPHGCAEVQLRQERMQRQWQIPARAYEHVAPCDASDVANHLRASEFEEAERLLISKLKELPPSPFHVICDARITSRPQELADYLDEFVLKARADAELVSIYVEMNAFAINPELWFCSGFGFSFDGGREDTDWLGDFSTWMDDVFVLEGFEEVQRVFAELPSELYGAFGEARSLTEALVIVKFQRFLTVARTSMKHTDFALLASAHDHPEYVAEIR